MRPVTVELHADEVMRLAFGSDLPVFRLEGVDRGDGNRVARRLRLADQEVVDDGEQASIAICAVEVPDARHRLVAPPSDLLEGVAELAVPIGTRGVLSPTRRAELDHQLVTLFVVLLEQLGHAHVPGVGVAARGVEVSVAHVPFGEVSITGRRVGEEHLDGEVVGSGGEVRLVAQLGQRRTTRVVARVSRFEAVVLRELARRLIELELHVGYARGDGHPFRVRHLSLDQSVQRPAQEHVEREPLRLDPSFALGRNAHLFGVARHLDHARANTRFDLDMRLLRLIALAGGRLFDERALKCSQLAVEDVRRRLEVSAASMTPIASAPLTTPASIASGT